jgi:predicted Zn-dependent protease
MPAQVDLGHVFVLMNQPKEALPHLLVAAKSDPSEPSVHFWLARAYRMQGNTSLAGTEMAEFSRLTNGQSNGNAGPVEKKQQ